MSKERLEDLHSLVALAQNIMAKSIYFTSFPKETLSIYFEHNRNSIET